MIKDKAKRDRINAMMSSMVFETGQKPIRQNTQPLTAAGKALKKRMERGW